MGDRPGAELDRLQVIEAEALELLDRIERVEAKLGTVLTLERVLVALVLGNSGAHAAGLI